ncbi:hypothetical protein FRC19_004409 [Serendipita sp. 401]|nr:hypothetical protein FRC19_004409 [Serendipita sp. 401]
MRWGFSTLLLLLSVLSSTVQAREQVLFTSSITYCAPPEVLIVQEFDIQYFNSNTSIAFALSATNFDPHLNATANIVLNTYGLTPFNISQSLCDILQGQLDLCPLPEANVTGKRSLTSSQ